MVSCATSRSWLWYQRGFMAVSLGGGLLMLLGAGAAHDSASIPLLVIGGAWVAIGAGTWWQSRRVAYELRLEDGQLTFVFPARDLRIPAGDVLGFTRGRFDPGRMKPLLARTRSHGTIKVSPRLTGLFDFLQGLREVNPNVAIPDL